MHDAITYRIASHPLLALWMACPKERTTMGISQIRPITDARVRYMESIRPPDINYSARGGRDMSAPAKPSQPPAEVETAEDRAVDEAFEASFGELFGRLK